MKASAEVPYFRDTYPAVRQLSIIIRNALTPGRSAVQIRDRPPLTSGNELKQKIAENAGLSCLPIAAHRKKLSVFF
jgi:hypothetical protein